MSTAQHSECDIELTVVQHNEGVDEIDKESGDDRVTEEDRGMEEVEEHPEGGWGWSIVMGAFCTKLLLSGSMKTLGVLLPTLQHQFAGVAISKLGFTCALLGTLSDVSGLFSAPLCKVFGMRAVAVFGGLLCSISLILASFVTTIDELAVCLAFAGFGFGLPLVPTIDVIGFYFTKRFALAIGLVYAGTGVGIIILTPVAQVFLSTYGWRDTLMLLGALCLHVMINGVILRTNRNASARGNDVKLRCEDKNIRPNQHEKQHPPRLVHRKQAKTCHLKETEKPLLSDSLSKEDSDRRNSNASTSSLSDILEDEGKGVRSRCLSCCKNLFPLGLLRSPLLALILILHFCGRFTLVGWLLYFIPYLEGKGLSPLVSVSIASVSGIFSTIARATYGLVIDYGILTAERLYIIFTAIMAISFMLGPVLYSYGPNMVAAMLIGVANGIILPITTVLLKQSISRDEFLSSLSLSYGVSALSRMLAGLIIGKLYSITGSFDEGFLMMGILHAFTVLVIIAYMIIKRRHPPPTE